MAPENQPPPMEEPTPVVSAGPLAPSGSEPAPLGALDAGDASQTVDGPILNGPNVGDSGDATGGSEVDASGDNEDGESGESEADGEGAEAEGREAGEAGGEPGAPKKRKRKRKKKPASEAPRATERAPFHVGEEVFGKVTAVVDAAIMVDLSGKALAIFDRSEMEPDDLVPEVSDRFVGRVLTDGARGGLVVLTRKPLREEETKPKIEQAAKDGSFVFGLVTGVIKGGAEVMLDGLRAFAPASGLDLHPRDAHLQQLLGTRLDFKVTTYDKQGRDVVVTRRPMLEKEAHERRKHAREALTEGAELAGVVRTVVDWGAFVALPEVEYLEGLVHSSELSHNPRDKVLDVLKPGQKIRVKVMKIDEKGKIWLSRKALLEDPYAKVFESVKIGSVVEGVGTKVEEFGAFIQIAEGVEGLCHVADIGSVRIDDARKAMNVGDKVRVLVHHFDEKSKRIGLHPALPQVALPQAALPEGASPEDAPPQFAPAEEKQKLVKGGKVDVEVAKIEPVGLHVRVLGSTGRHARGFIPAGQTGTPRGTELRSTFTVGQRLSVSVLEIDPKRGELKLSVSRLHQDEERRAHKEYQTKVKAESSFGTLGDLLKRRMNGE
jgi:small subunit ribosomal protein S1